MASGRISEKLSFYLVDREGIAFEEFEGLLDGTYTRSPVTIAIEAVNDGFGTHEAESLGLTWELIDTVEENFANRLMWLMCGGVSFDFNSNCRDIWDDLVIMGLTEDDMPALGDYANETMPLHYPEILDTRIQDFIAQARTHVLNAVYQVGEDE